MIVYKDEHYGFYELFNENNGTLIRSDVDGVDPICRSFPELLDIGVMGHCSNSVYCKAAGVDCYQRGQSVNAPHMSAKQFESIVRQASGKTFQIALGGAGDPNKHPCFKELLEICRYYRIVPNLTTSGFGITQEEIRIISEYCGAAAISWYSRLIDGIESNYETINTIRKLIDSGCTTNVHFVVSADTIDEAIFRLKNNLFPKGINAVIFILYKPVGYGKRDKVLSDSEKLEQFLELATNYHPYRIGFDTCFTSALVKYCMGKIPGNCIDACEAGRFSMYIDSRMNAYPCSFGIDNKELCMSLNQYCIRDVWNSTLYQNFRKRKNESCKGCNEMVNCLGGCRIGLDIHCW